MAAASLVRNKYVYNALVMAFYKIAPYHAQKGAEADAGFVKCVRVASFLSNISNNSDSHKPHNNSTPTKHTHTHTRTGTAPISWT